MAITIILTLLFALLLPLAESRVVHSACLNETGLFGLKLDESIDEMDPTYLTGDIEQVSKMPLMKVAYSRPHKITICSNDLYINAIQINLQLQPLEGDDYRDTNWIDSTIEKVQKMDLFADESSSAYEGTRMKMFGTY